VACYTPFTTPSPLQNGAVVDRLEGANPGELSKKVALHLKDTGTANGFPTKPSTPAPTATLSSVKASTSKEDLHAKLTALVKSRPVLLFMKGNPDAPRCGFSSKVVAALKEENVPFGSFDILGDEEVRQGMKEFSNWPTFPQLYVNGELVGGCDIVLEMHQSGELKELFEKEGVLTVDKVTTSETKVTDSEQVQDKGVVEGGRGKLEERLEKLVNSKPVVLFMKGTPEAPRCGFSQKVVKALREEGVDFGSFDILSDEEVRQGLKAYSNWPTYPQLYSKGELVGGCDIILEMHESGELKEALTG
jgi:Grx4 family monothiol glutaredoxin